MKLAMGRSYAHKGLTDMKREDSDDWEEIEVDCRIIHPELGECFVGGHLCGIGAFHVHFPVDAVRVATEEEIERFTRGRYGRTYGPPFQLQRSDFLTQEELRALPLVDQLS